jgi:putative peptidoglycan lipid II flippase
MTTIGPGPLTATTQGRNRAALLMSAGTLMSRITGFARVIALAYALGLTHRLTDAYNLANTTPNIVFDFVLGGILSATLIPVFVNRLATRPAGEAWEAISAVVSLVGVLLVALTVVFEIAAPLLIRIYTFSSPHSAGEIRAATSLLRLFAPQLALYGFIVLSTALLNTARKFSAPMFAPIANNVLVIVVLVLVHHLSRGMNVENFSAHRAAFWLLGWGTTAGVAINLLAQLPALRNSGLHLRWVWAPGHEIVRRMLGLSGWTFGFVAANQVALWVTLLLANRRTGDVTIWTTAYTFFQLPYGIAAVSIMSALQPTLAEAWARRSRSTFRARTAGGLRSINALMVPAAVAYLLLARPALTLVLRHGATGGGGADRAAAATALLALGLPGFCAFQLLIRAFQAMQNTRTPFYLYALENGLNVVLAFALYPALGVRGLALAMSGAYSLSALAAGWTLRRRLAGIQGRSLLTHLGRLLSPTLVMAVVVVLIGAVLSSGSTPMLILRVVLAGTAGGAAYFGTAGLLAGLRIRRARLDGSA